MRQTESERRERKRTSQSQESRGREETDMLIEVIMPCSMDDLMTRGELSRVIKREVE